MGTYYDGRPATGATTAWTGLTDTPGAITPDGLVVGDALGSALSFRDPDTLKEGITYSWANGAERVSQTGMVANELGVQRDTGDVYKYDGLAWSVFFSLTAGGTTPRQESLTTQTITGADVALTDTLDFLPSSAASVVLSLNGVQQDQGVGKDYTISGQTITWLAGSGTAVDMDPSDLLEVNYTS